MFRMIISTRIIKQKGVDETGGTQKIIINCRQIEKYLWRHLPSRISLTLHHIFYVSSTFFVNTVHTDVYVLSREKAGAGSFHVRFIFSPSPLHCVLGGKTLDLGCTTTTAKVISIYATFKSGVGVFLSFIARESIYVLTRRNAEKHELCWKIHKSVCPNNGRWCVHAEIRMRHKYRNGNCSLMDPTNVLYIHTYIHRERERERGVVSYIS